MNVIFYLLIILIHTSIISFSYLLIYSYVFLIKIIDQKIYDELFQNLMDESSMFDEVSFFEVSFY